MIDFSSEKPIFIQVAEEIEDAILTGAFLEETKYLPQQRYLSATK